MDKFYEILTVCVTKQLQFLELYPIINQFIKQGITFGISQHGVNHYSLWREPLYDEHNRTYHELDNYGGIIEVNPSLLNSRKFIFIWSKGNPVMMEECVHG